MASPSSGPATFGVSQITASGFSLAFVTPDQAIDTLGIRSTSNWQVDYGGGLVEPDEVQVIAGGDIRITKSEITPATRVVYDGADATLASATGDLLAAFDHVVPFP